MNSRSIETEQVWRELHADLLTFIRRRVSDDAQADDLLQEVFLRIHNRLASLEEVDRLRAWVYQIVRHAVTDHYRAASRKPSAAVLPEFIDDDSAAENLNSEVSQWLGKLVDALPASYRDAVQLSELAGLSQKEVAGRLGLSLSGAKSRIQRGRLMLKEALLQCCHFEFDERGNVIDYNRHSGCKDCCDDKTDCR